jgi:hypothetical protein
VLRSHFTACVRFFFACCTFSVFFLRYACELNVFCLSAPECAHFLPHACSTYFCQRWSVCFLPHARSAFFYLRYIACLCWSTLERARSAKPSVSRVILTGRAGKSFGFFSLTLDVWFFFACACWIDPNGRPTARDLVSGGPPDPAP